MSSVPSSSIEDQSSIASTVLSPYLRETKKTISAPKISAVPQSYISAIDSNKNSLPIFERNQKEKIEKFSENSYGTQKRSPLRKCIFERNANHEPILHNVCIYSYVAIVVHNIEYYT